MKITTKLSTFILDALKAIDDSGYELDCCTECTDDVNKEEGTWCWWLDSPANTINVSTINGYFDVYDGDESVFKGSCFINCNEYEYKSCELLIPGPWIEVVVDCYCAVLEKQLDVASLVKDHQELVNGFAVNGNDYVFPEPSND